MAKRQPRSKRTLTPAEEKRMRQWRGCGVLFLAIIVLLSASYVALKLFRREQSDEDHPHQPAPHGGVIVSVGGDDGHYHVEALLDKGHTLKLYTYGEGVEQVLAVESQVLTALVKPVDRATPTSVTVMPMPQPEDPEGKASRFFGKLPEELSGQRLTIRVPNLSLAGRQFDIDFTAAQPHAHEANPHEPGEEEKLFSTQSGKYTEADIKANGGVTASERFQGFEASHDVRPRRGEKLCPVSLTKANPEFTWSVSNKVYAFCCPPCIDEFVRRAKEQPEAIREPQEYVKK